MIAGVLFGLGASACWAIANVAVQGSARRVGTPRALAWSQLIGLALAVAAAPFVDDPGRRPGVADLGWLAGAGGAALIAYVCMFYAFEHGRLTVAVPIMSSWAVLASALSLVLLHEHVRPLQLVGATAVVAGALVVSRYAQREGEAAAARGGARWALASVVAAVGFGLLIPAIGHLAPVLGSLRTVAAVYAVALALGAPLAWRARISLAPPPAGALLPVALAGFFEATGFACISLGGRRAPLAVISPLSSLASAFTVVYAWLVLRERPRLLLALGAALACAGVVVVAL
jgi:uncharacterized membrane protein